MKTYKRVCYAIADWAVFRLDLILRDWEDKLRKR